MPTRPLRNSDHHLTLVESKTFFTEVEYREELMSLNEATKENLRRKSAYVDAVQLHDDLPLFSWVDINITELCNRKCVFCPRIDEAFYPNQSLHMSEELALKIGSELAEIDYQGVVVFSGYSEPTLHPHFKKIVGAFPSQIRLELITNGDALLPKKITEYAEAGIDYFVVSLYDGPDQIETFHERFAEADLSEDRYVLRDRWHNDEDSFGLKLTNRGGTVEIGNQPEVDLSHPCFYTAYSMTIDWNGDVLLCMQDWHKKVKMGNVTQQSLTDVWQSRPFNDFRQKLIAGDRSCAPCNNCNTDGTLHGFNHADRWLELQKK